MAKVKMNKLQHRSLRWYVKYLRQYNCSIRKSIATVELEVVGKDRIFVSIKVVSEGAATFVTAANFTLGPRGGRKIYSEYSYTN
jgi:hypothetical protein